MKNTLTQQDKYIIQGMLHDNYEVKDIASALNRKSKTVQNYIETELDQLHGTIAKVQLEQFKQDVEEEKQQLKSKRIPKNKGFINTTGGGQKGVAISTNVASSQSDELKKQYPKELSRRIKGNLYSINEQEIKK